MNRNNEDRREENLRKAHKEDAKSVSGITVLALIGAVIVVSLAYMGYAQAKQGATPGYAAPAATATTNGAIKPSYNNGSGPAVNSNTNTSTAPGYTAGATVNTGNNGDTGTNNNGTGINNTVDTNSTTNNSINGASGQAR